MSSKDLLLRGLIVGEVMPLQLIVIIAGKFERGGKVVAVCAYVKRLKIQQPPTSLSVSGLLKLGKSFLCVCLLLLAQVTVRGN